MPPPPSTPGDAGRRPITGGGHPASVGRPADGNNPLLGGRYRLERIVGKGAMGRVWAAHDLVLNRPVAIKQVDFPPGMPAAELDQVVQRTMREARAVASVSDPHVVTIFDLLPLPQGPAIVMELLAARSLGEILAADGPLDETEAATIGLSVAAGLLAAHAVGIIHRDVKPGNVLICSDGRIKLTDFGIARSTGEQAITATGLLLGSPAYISPEVASGAPADPRTDAWGLGALLFACMQGVPPYDRGTPLATLAAVVQEPVPPHPRSGRLGGIIGGLLTKDPAARMSVGTAHRFLLHIATDTGRLVTHRLPPASPATPHASPSSPAPRVSSGPPAGSVGPPAGLVGPPAGLVGPPAGSVGPPAGSVGRLAGSVGSPSLRRPAAGPVTGSPTPAGGLSASAHWSPQPVLPPPPWAGAGGASALRALPVRAGGRGRRQQVVLAIVALVIGIIAALAGFLAVRTIAHVQTGVPIISFSAPRDIAAG